MPNARITSKWVDSLGAAPREVVFWDTHLRGFGLKVSPSGSKTYLVQYRMGGRGSPTRRFTIGRHLAPWTPPTARAEAERLLRAARTGDDPRSTLVHARQEARDLGFSRYAEFFYANMARNDGAAAPCPMPKPTCGDGSSRSGETIH